MINILGTDYEIKEVNQCDVQQMKDDDCLGLCNLDAKVIYIATDIADTSRLYDITLKHELIHAFLYESGIEFSMQFHTEECVDWFATQFNKIYKASQDYYEEKVGMR